MKHTDFRADISNIKTILEEYKWGFSVIKELIQNSNDSESSELIFGFHEPDTGFRHSLLRDCPSLFVINNGKFTAKDAYAINEAISSGKDDKLTTGKFGIGLNSVFHYCEGFFYAASAIKGSFRNIDMVAEKDYGFYERTLNMVTPWDSSAPKNPYRHWQLELEQNWNADRQEIVRLLDPYIRDMTDWFIVWIPLRSKKMINEHDCIIDEFWEDSSDKIIMSLFCDINYAMVSYILPMLHSLHKVKFVNKSQIEAEIVHSAPRIPRLKEIENCYLKKKRIIDSLQGEVILKTGSVIRRVEYFLKQDIALSEDVLDLYNDIKAKGHKILPPHVGILMVKNTGSNSKDKFKFHYSNTLPLSDKNDLIDAKYNLFLHGCFFVNSRRQYFDLALKDNQQTEKQREAKWNQDLFRHALQLIPKALNDFSKVYETSFADLEEISKVVCTEVNVKEQEVPDCFRELCHAGQWVSRVRKGILQWELIPREDYFEISHDYLNHVAKLPNLKHMSENYNLIIPNAGCMLLDQYRQEWGENLIDAFWSVDIKDITNDREFAQYWLKESFERIGAFEEIPYWHLRFFNKIKALILGLPFTLVHKYHSSISNLLDSFKDKVIVLDFEKSGHWKQLNEVLADYLALPSDYQDWQETNPKLPASLINKVLQWMPSNNEELKRICHGWAIDILANCELGELDIAYRNLPLIQLVELDKGTEFYSINEIQELCVLASNSKKELCRLISKAFECMPVYLMNLAKSNPEKNIPGLDSVVTASIEYIAKQFSKWSFGSLEDRLKLLEYLCSDLGEAKIKGYRNVIRALLAGKRELDQNEKLYLYKNKSIWYKLSVALWEPLGRSFDKIAYTQGISFTDTLSNELGVYTVSKDHIPPELYDNMPKNINLTWMTLAERETVYRRLTDLDENDYRLLKLPIFQPIDGDWISIAERLESTYMVGYESNSNDIPKSSLTILKFNEVLHRCTLIKSLDHNAMARMYLGVDEPSQYMEKIVDLLAQLSSEEMNLLELDDIPWIKIKDTSFGLNRVLYHMHITKELRLVIDAYSSSSESPEFYITYNELPNTLKDKNLIDKLKNTSFWDEEMILRVMGKLIGGTSPLNIFRISEEADWNDYYPSVEYALNDHEIIRILNRCKQNVSPEKIDRLIKPCLFINNPPIPQQIEILTSWANAIERDCLVLESSVIYTHFITVLKEYLHGGSGLDLLREIRLPNSKGVWLPSSRLCLNDTLVNRDHVLEIKLGELLSHDYFANIVHKPELIILDNQTEYDMDNLLEYLRLCSRYINKNLIGVFLAFLADGDPKWRQWADSNFFSEVNSVESVRSSIKKPWIDEFQLCHQNKPDYLANVMKEIEEKIWDTKINLRFVSHPDSSQAHSLTGDIIQFQSEPSLLRFVHRDDTSRVVDFDFHMLDIDAIGVDGLKKCLHDALNLLVLKAYQLTPKQSLVESLVWNQLDVDNQVSISIVQEVIKSEMMHTFKRLRIGREIEQVRKLEQQDKEMNYKRVTGKFESNEEADKSYMDQRRELEANVSIALHDENVQRAILKGVRQELERFQYDLSSILFELFQNADDACSELENLSRKTENYTFQVIPNPDDGTISVLHNGRFINEQEGNIYSSEMSNYFSNDLHKMLTLNYSDKQGDWLTGKFGLGFKSIYLATDEPWIVSGRLNFKIVGGMYPEPLKSEELATLQCFVNNSDVTVFSIRTGSPEVYNRLLSVFDDYAFLMPLMSKKIKNVRFGLKEFSYSTEEFFENINLFTMGSSRFLAFKGISDWNIVFKISGCELSGFEDICPVWVTVPALGTRSEYKFLINANFNLDVGRKQLATCTHNNDLALTIGKEFADTIKKLIDSQGSFEDNPSLLDKSGLDCSGLWKSLFFLLSDGISWSGELSDIDRVFWELDEDNYLGIICSNQLIPNDLAEPFSCLVSLNDIRYCIPDYLNNSHTLSVLENSGLSKNTLISQNIRDRIAGLLDHFSIKELDYEQIANALCPDKQLSPQIAEGLGSVLIVLEQKISPEVWETLGRGSSFNAKDGTWHPAEILVLDNDPDLEGFISHSKLLSRDYADRGLWLFKKFQGQGSIISDGIISAKGIASQKAALSYLLKHWDEYKETVFGADWLLTLDPDSDITDDLDDEQRKKLVELIRQIAIWALGSPMAQYSFKWFKTILWALNYGKKDEYKSVSQSVRFDAHKLLNDKIILQLSMPRRYILQSYETAKNIKLSYGDNSKPLTSCKIESVTLAPDYVEVLFDKPLSESLIREFMPNTQFTLQFEDFVDVSRLWQKAYHDLSYEDDDCLKNELSEHIEFIFGPPGTGKTFTLASKLTKLAMDCGNILVLAPTNAAADELINKLIEQNSPLIDHTVRFGNCTNLEINNLGIVSNPGKSKKDGTILTVTTAIRFPYDGYRMEKFASTPWDYIIFDESSMLPVHFVTYIIIMAAKHNKDCKFIVAGDPLQIPPIYNFPEIMDDRQLAEKMDMFKSEVEEQTIYSMVGLTSFQSSVEEYQLSPYEYHVEQLLIQRRCLEPIGELFSKYCYNGNILHEANIDPESIPSLPTSKQFNPKPITIVRCPVIGGDVYHSRSVKKSSTHPYSALLVVEYIKSIVNILGAEHSVGIICPYRSQADLVKKLMAKQNFDNLMYQADTIHGFQGGQKDIVFCIFNTPLKYPPTSKTTQFIAGTQNAIMLNKRYIINVGVSRARKYLFLLIPDYYNKDTKANIPGYKNLTELNDLLEIIKNRIDPQFVLDIHSDIMEKHMFGTQSYILENSILIPHDKVNVYQRSPKHYLISHDENNIDVQLDYRTLDSRGELESVNAQSDKKVSQPAKLES